MAGSYATKSFRSMNLSIFALTLKCLVFLLLIAGCESTGPKAIIGGAGGAAAGGLLGAAFKGGPEGIAAGAILGGLLGGVVGDRLDAADRRLAAQTQQRALETVRTGEVAPWRNPDSGHSGQITPTLTYQNATGQYCREFTHTVYIDGKAQKAHGSACREPDGTWRLVST